MSHIVLNFTISNSLSSESGAIERDTFFRYISFFNLHLLTLLLSFLSDQLGDTKTIRPFALKGHGSRPVALAGLFLLKLIVKSTEPKSLSKR